MSTPVVALNEQNCVDPKDTFSKYDDYVDQLCASQGIPTQGRAVFFQRSKKPKMLGG